MRSYMLHEFESGDVEITQSHDGKLNLTIHCAPADKNSAEIEIRFHPMDKDRIIGLLTPFRFEIRGYEDDAA